MRSWLTPAPVAHAALTVDFDSPSALILIVVAAAALLAAVVVGRRIPGGIGAAAAMGVTVPITVFGLLSLEARRAGAGTGVDHAVLGWLLARRTWWLTRLAIMVTDLGSPAVVAALTAAAAAAVWWQTRSPRNAIVLLATVSGAATVSTVTKHVVTTQPPPVADRVIELIHQSGPSFPSGHATSMLALAGIAAVIVGQPRSRGVRVALAAGAAVVTLAVAATRLYLGVHWLTDVLAGLLLAGSAVLLGSAFLAPRYFTHAGPDGSMMKSAQPR